MFVKDLNIAYLLDFYGDVLSERTRDLLTMYYCDDLSLAEIAENVGISRQGVRQAIKKGEDELESLEAKLGLAALHLVRREEAETLLRLARQACSDPTDENTRALSVFAQSFAERFLADNQE